MTAETIHTCSYSCERPACIRAQRDELAARMTAETSNARGEWVLVPREPTAEMREAILENRIADFFYYGDTSPKEKSAAAGEVYAAMLAATPPPPADAEVRAPSYDALLLIAQSVCGALERAGVTDCDDPGEAIDVLREQYEAKIAALSQQPEARGVVDGWRLVIHTSERDNEPGVWAERDGSFVWIAALTEARNVR